MDFDNKADVVWRREVKLLTCRLGHVHVQLPLAPRYLSNMTRLSRSTVSNVG